MPQLAPHLHTDTCNKLIADLAECHKNHPYKKFIGVCNHATAMMQACLRLERERNRKANHQKAKERKERQTNFSDLLQKDIN